MTKNANQISLDLIREFKQLMQEIQYYNWGNNINKDYKYRKFSNYFYNECDWEITEQRLNIF